MGFFNLSIMPLVRAAPFTVFAQAKTVKDYRMFAPPRGKNILSEKYCISNIFHSFVTDPGLLPVNSRDILLA